MSADELSDSRKKKRNEIKINIHFSGKITDDFSKEIRTECRCKRYTVSIFRSIEVNDTLKYENQRNRLHRILGNSEYFHCSLSFLCWCRYSSFSLHQIFTAQFILFSIFFHHSFYLRFFFNFYDSEIIFVDVSQFPTERLISSGMFAWKDRTKKGQISSHWRIRYSQYESSNVKGWTQFYFWYEMLILEIHSHPNAYASPNTHALAHTRAHWQRNEKEGERERDEKI